MICLSCGKPIPFGASACWECKKKHSDKKKVWKKVGGGNNEKFDT